MTDLNIKRPKSGNQKELASKFYWPTFVSSLGLTLRNFHVVILMELYALAFYLGCYLFVTKKYVLAGLVFLLFTCFISSTFYMVGQIVKTGKFPIRDLFKSYKVLYVRANSVLILWYFVFFLINYALITPISVLIKGPFLLYGVIIPMQLLLFLVFNSLPEAIYASDKNFESLFMDSINFIEKYWIVWLVPTLIFMFLLNLTDHRLDIRPTLGALKPHGILLKIQDVLFYVRTLILTIALVFRGLLYIKLTEQTK